MGSFLSLDTETTMAPFHETPDLVLFAGWNGSETFFVKREDVFDFLYTHKGAQQVWHNYPFDRDVLVKHDPRILDLLIFAEEQGHVWDTMILYRLYMLAKEGNVPFKYSLKHCCQEELNIDISKESEVRTTFEDYLHTPIEQIPSAHLDYAASDVIHTGKLFKHLIKKIRVLNGGDESMLSHGIQILGAVALQQVYKNGIGLDQEKREKYLEEKNKLLEINQEILASEGWIRGVKGANQQFNEIVDYLELDLPKTENGDYSSKAEDLEQYGNIPFIRAYLEYIKIEKETTFVRDLTDTRVHPRYDLLKNTGRTGCSKPNFQQLPRAGEIRSMFIPTKGNVFLITDYSTLELCTLAQICYDYYGFSTMRDMINDGRDPHRYFASVITGKSEEEITKDERQKAKAANFGFPGGLGAPAFREYASTSYGVDITLEESSELRQKWIEAFPEMKNYLRGEDSEVWTLTGRIRSNCFYSAGKNTPFQGLAADGAKCALYDLNKEGFKIVGFVHDEIITECPPEQAHSQLKKQEQIMIDAMNYVVPDVTITVESVISECYTK